MASRARQDSGLIRWRLKPSNRPLWWLIQWKEGLAGPPELEKDENEWEKRKILESYRVVLIVGLPPKLASFWIISSQNSSIFLKYAQIFSQILHFLPARQAGTIKATLVIYLNHSENEGERMLLPQFISLYEAVKKIRHLSYIGAPSPPSLGTFRTRSVTFRRKTKK